MVWGKWHIPKLTKRIVYSDVTGVSVEINDVVAKKVTWLRKSSDYNHINMLVRFHVKLGLEMKLKESKDQNRFLAE